MIDTLAQNSTPATGEVGNYIAAQGNKLEISKLKPYLAVNSEGVEQTYITVFTGLNKDGKKTFDRNDVNAYKAVPINVNGTLRLDEWKLLDDAVLKISEARLSGLSTLRERGLTKDIGNGLDSTVFVYEDSSDAMEATQSMDGLTKSQGDRPVFTTKYIPLPITHVDYEINARVLAESRNKGMALDTFSAERAARRVSEYLEKQLFTDQPYTAGGGTIYGYTNEPNRNTGTFVNSWSAEAATGAKIIADVMTIKNALINAKHYGPYEIYIPIGYETKMDEDYKADGDKTIRQRILEIDKIEKITVIDTLAADTVLMVQMTSDVVRILDGMPLQNVEWGMEGNMVTKYKVMTIQVVQVRSDQDGNSGVAHYQKA